MSNPSETKSAIHLGYRLPRTAAEQKFWTMFSPDYRAWAFKTLSIDEATALAMGLDPRCVNSLEFEEIETNERFRATRACIIEMKQYEGVLNLIELSLFGETYGLRFDEPLKEVASFVAEGLFDRDEKVTQLKRENALLQQTIEQLNETVAILAVQKCVTPVLTGAKRAENKSAKIIVALLASLYPDEASRIADFIKIKNSQRSGAVSIVKDRVELFGWTIDDATVLERLRAGLQDWKSATSA
jgi:hypothetical protein